MEHQDTAQSVRAKDPAHTRRRLLIVLGSGWGDVADALIEIEGEAAYGELPGFPKSTVQGHAGRLIWGNLSGVPVYCMQGRQHYYEGYSMDEVTFPIRVFAALGIRGVLLTNAAGGINREFSVGDLMLIQDHVNLMGSNPLRGPNLDAFGPRFPDMTHAWDEELQSCLAASSGDAGITLRRGIYLAVSGPSFETPAEIRAFASLGADAVGMSTVPECIVARHCGLRVAGLSCVSNLAAHAGGGVLTHEDVAKAARQSQDGVVRLLSVAIPRMHELL